MSPTSITFGLKYQARVLRAQITEKEKSQWYVATNCLREENEVSNKRYVLEEIIVGGLACCEVHF